MKQQTLAESGLQMDRIRAALRTAERLLGELLASIEGNDVTPDAVKSQARLIEESLRRVRQAA